MVLPNEQVKLRPANATLHHMLIYKEDMVVRLVRSLCLLTCTTWDPFRSSSSYFSLPGFFVDLPGCHGGLNTICLTAYGSSLRKHVSRTEQCPHNERLVLAAACSNKKSEQ